MKNLDRALQALLILAGAATLGSSLGACKWTDFDDLKDEAWVTATPKPDNGSTNWAVAIAPGKRTTGPNDGGKLAVIGTAESIYNEIEYTATGGSKIAGNQQELNNQFGIGNLEPQPILLADPTTDDIALVTKSGTQQVVVLRGTSGDLNPHQVFGPDSADAATYMIAPAVDGGATPQPAQPLVASQDKVYGTFYSPPEQPFQQPKCQLVDGATPVQVRALGTVRLAPANLTDDVVVWSSTGNLYIYAGGVFDGARAPTVCPDLSPADTDNTGTAAPGALLAGPFAVGFTPSVGSQIHVFGGHFAILQGHNDSTGGFLALVDLATMTLVGPPHTEDGLKTATMFELGGVPHVVAGYPLAVVDGVTSGQVLVFKLDTASGISASPIETLHDAQPDDSQTFGRAVTVFQFNGKPVIAVAADNEAFAYFRLNSYADTRQGR